MQGLAPVYRFQMCSTGALVPAHATSCRVGRCGVVGSTLACGSTFKKLLKTFISVAWYVVNLFVQYSIIIVINGFINIIINIILT